MGTGGPMIVCARCGQVSPTGTRYCPRCGEAVAPELVAELRRLYDMLQDLDGHIAAGKGGQTVAELREEYRSRYLALRSGPASPPLAAPGVAAAAGALPNTPTAPVGAPGPGAPVAPATPPAAQPAGPIFSWRAFVAEQAIAIMAYLGGFLLLVATLSFEVGAWQVLPNLVKLAVVVGVYVVFGALGAAMRRSARLRTVGRAYLGVFALMTPLVGLAVYRFYGTQLAARGFGPSGMLCVAALYAAIVYLALALRTRFATYAYLGWTALVVGVLAIVPWSAADVSWSGVAGAALGLALLLPRRVRGWGIAAALGTPALLVGAVVGAGAALYVELLGPRTVALRAQGLEGGAVMAAFAVAACVLVPLAVGWSVTARDFARLATTGVVEAADVLGIVLAAQAPVAIGLWLDFDRPSVALTLAAVSLAELGGALAVWVRWPRLVHVRYAAESVALGLAAVGSGLVFLDATPNRPLAAALAAGVLAGVGIAVAEDAPWWLLAAGLFLTLEEQTLGSALLPSNQLEGAAATSYAGLALALWAVALGLGTSARTRRFAPAVFVVALGDAAYATLLLPLHHGPLYQTGVLLAFTIAAFVAGRHMRWPLAGGLAAGGFGLLVALPFALNDTNALPGAALALGLALAALGVRRALGRVWAWAPYAIALVALAIAVLHAGAPGANTAGWEALGLPFGAWLLLVGAALAVVAAIGEREPLATAVAALLGLWTVFLPTHHVPAIALVLALAAAGAALRQWRGRYWNAPFEVAAALGSVWVVARLSDVGVGAGRDQSILLLAFAVVAYLLAAQDRQPWLTAVAGAYGLAAAALMPDPGNFVPALALTFVAAGLGVGLRIRFGRPWALAAYAVAVGASVLAALRVTPFDAGHVEALLLVFAAVAYFAAVVEREPWAGIAPALYVTAAVVVQPDAHALLPVALGTAVLGLLAGRVAGPRWSWPLYAASAVAAAATALLGQGQGLFEATALLAIALAAYAIAALESRPDVLPLALVLGVLALASAVGVWELADWQIVLAFAGLGAAYVLGGWAWEKLPGLRPHGLIWWAARLPDPEARARWGDPRRGGWWVHAAGGLLVAAGTVVAALVTPDAFTHGAAETQAIAVALLVLGGLLALLGLARGVRPALYAAGEMVALAITWEARWLGADNIQAFVLAPGSYQMLIGALLPSERRVPFALRLGQAASVVGALILLIPTLYQSFQPDRDWIYAIALAVEALIIAGVGVGTRSR
ncbi:MAG TPA: zinc ribbon domain-containing protein, partial [Ktedonobacterales bacterium]